MKVYILFRDFERRAYYPNLYACNDCGIVTVAHERWMDCPVCALLERLGLSKGEVSEPVSEPAQ